MILPVTATIPLEGGCSPKVFKKIEEIQYINDIHIIKKNTAVVRCQWQMASVSKGHVQRTGALPLPKVSRLQLYLKPVYRPLCVLYFILFFLVNAIPLSFTQTLKYLTSYSFSDLHGPSHSIKVVIWPIVWISGVHSPLYIPCEEEGNIRVIEWDWIS